MTEHEQEIIDMAGLGSLGGHVMPQPGPLPERVGEPTDGRTSVGVFDGEPEEP